MTRRAELARRLAALTDIASILSAMKSLAMMEIRLLADLIPAQRRMVAGIEAAAADFLAWHPDAAAAPDDGPSLCVVVGSEQGFCGDFNDALVERLRASQGSGGAGRRVVVGRRLAARLAEQAELAAVLPGATVADEVQPTLLRLTSEIARLLAGGDTGDGRGLGSRRYAPPPAGGAAGNPRRTASRSRSGPATQGRPSWPGLEAARRPSLSVLYHDAAADEIRLRRLLPLGDLPPAPPHPYAAELDLPPAQFIAGLTHHYLYAALNEVLYSALLAENRRRQAHMERALQRLDEQTDRLRRAANAQRQEEITEEIEVLLLSGEALQD